MVYTYLMRQKQTKTSKKDNNKNGLNFGVILTFCGQKPRFAAAKSFAVYSSCTFVDIDCGGSGGGTCFLPLQSTTGIVFIVQALICCSVTKKHKQTIDNQRLKFIRN